MQLYKTALISVFGQGSANPLRAVLVRLLGLACLAVASGHLLSNGIDQIEIIATLNPYILGAIATIVIQVIIAFVLLAALGITRNTEHDSFARLLLTWPLSRGQRWFAVMLPTIILAVLALLLIAEPITLLMIKLGLTAGWIAGAFFVGTTSALGLMFGFSKLSAGLHIVAAVGVVWLEYLLLRKTIDQTTYQFSLLYGFLLGALLLVLIVLLPLSVHTISESITRSRRNRTPLFTFLPPLFWFGKKLSRSSTRLSFFAAFGLSIASTAPYFYNNSPVEISMAGLLAAVLAGSVASDVRSLARRVSPPEITTLRATVSYVLTEYVWILVYASLSVSPLFYGIFTAAPEPSQLVTIVLQLLVGITAGAWASTLIAPAARDIMGQFLTSILCLSVLIGLPQIPFIQSLSQTWLHTCNIIVITLLFATMCGIEYKRNAFTWRHRYERSITTTT